MISKAIQIELLLHYYNLWKDQPFRHRAMLSEINKKFESPFDMKIIEANAQYLIEKGLLEPRMTAGFHTRITLKGVLFIESIRYNPDVSLRTEILEQILMMSLRFESALELTGINGMIQRQENQVTRNGYTMARPLYP